MNVCRGLIKAREGAKVARVTWRKEPLVYLVLRCFVDPDDPRIIFDKYEGDICLEKNWLPDADDLLADDWRVLRGV